MTRSPTPDDPESVALADALRAALPAGARVHAQASVRQHYARDLAELPALLTGRLRSLPTAVVQPRDPEDVLAVMRHATGHGVPLVPRGMGSSGFWGSVPAHAGICVDLSAMDDVLALDPEAATITVAGGATWHHVDRAAGQHGLTVFTSPSSRHSTVAGWVATGGYGMDSYRHGHLCEHVVQVEVVTPEGGGLRRRVAADDADFALFSGTEGQFGVITAVTLRLRPRPPRYRAFLLQFDDPAAAMRCVAELSAEPVPATHVVFLDAGHLHELNAVRRIRHGDREAARLDERDAVLVYFDDLEAGQRFEAELPERLARCGGTSAARHLANLVFHDRYVPLKAKILGPRLMGAQVVLPLVEVAPYLETARRIARRFRAAFSAEAHLIRTPEGYRALVMAILPVDWTGTAGHLMHLGLAGLLTQIGIRRGGTPYSVGLWNAPHRDLKWDAATLRRLRERKFEVDPHGIVNPGKFPAPGGLVGLLLHPLAFALAMRIVGALSLVIGWLGLARLVSRRNDETLDPAAPLRRAAAECTYCGACQPVCPAWLTTRDIRVTARSKLQVGAKLLAGEPVDPDEARMAFVCLHCAECTRVCQALLPLVPVWQQLEAELTTQIGFPRETVDTFLTDLATSEPFQQRLLVHDPTLYHAIDARREIVLPLAATAGEAS